MKILAVADPMTKLRPLGDSTLAMVREALKRKHEVFWAHAEDLEYRGDHVEVHAALVLESSPDKLAVLGEPGRRRVDAFDVVLIRKDPPFDASYVKLCWLLGLAEKKVFMMNDPSTLLRYHEKLVPLEALAQGFLKADDIIPTHIGTSASAREFVRERGFGEVIAKPFLGFGGSDVSLTSKEAFLADKEEHGDRLVQPFREEIRKRGDRRVLYLGGKCFAHFVRMPRSGTIVSNLAQGGTAVMAPLTPREGESIARLGAFLEKAGIHFAGADLIGHFVSEVNLTSPTGLRSLEKLEGRDYADTIMDYVERNALSRTR